MQAAAEFVGPLWLGRGQVVLLADVLLDVVQLDVHVVEELDELEVAGADRAVGHRAALLIVLVVRVVPEQARRDRAARAAEQRDEAHAVEPVRPANRSLQAGHFHERRKQVHR